MSRQPESPKVVFSQLRVWAGSRRKLPLARMPFIHFGPSSGEYSRSRGHKADDDFSIQNGRWCIRVADKSVVVEREAPLSLPNGAGAIHLLQTSTWLIRIELPHARVFACDPAKYIHARRGDQASESLLGITLSRECAPRSLRKSISGSTRIHFTPPIFSTVFSWKVSRISSQKFAMAALERSKTGQECEIALP